MRLIARKYSISFTLYRKRPCTTLTLILHMYFVRLIFAQAMLSENILTLKYSRFTVYHIIYQLLRHFTNQKSFVPMSLTSCRGEDSKTLKVTISELARQSS